MNTTQASSKEHKYIYEKWEHVIDKGILTDDEYRVKYGKDKQMITTTMLLEGQEQRINSK